MIPLPPFKNLHRLSVKETIEYKIATYAFNSLKDTGPVHLNQKLTFTHT